MNKKAQVSFFTLMIGLTVIVLALGLAFPVKQTVDNAMNATQTSNITYEVSNGTAGGYYVNGTVEIMGMDCSNTSISTFNKGACIVTDMSMFYFIGGLIFMVGSILAARVLL